MSWSSQTCPVTEVKKINYYIQSFDTFRKIKHQPGSKESNLDSSSLRVITGLAKYIKNIIICNDDKIRDGWFKKNEKKNERGNISSSTDCSIVSVLVCFKAKIEKDIWSWFGLRPEKKKSSWKIKRLK